MIKYREAPDTIRPYMFHGVELNWQGGGAEATGTCPFCDRAGKFSVHMETSKYRCFVCDESGNPYTFIQTYWEQCQQSTSLTDYRQLATISGFIYPESAKEFGVVKSSLTGEWMIPGYNAEGKIAGLYRYAYISDQGKHAMLPTPTMASPLFGAHLYESHKPILDLCEGWRDGISWYETLKYSKKAGVSYLDNRNVLSVGGTNAFKPQWARYFAGKIVNILFDNDYPKVNEKTGKIVDPAGVVGVKRVASILMAADEPPESIHYIAWDGSAEGYSLELPGGCDVREFLNTPC